MIPQHQVLELSVLNICTDSSQTRRSVDMYDGNGIPEEMRGVDIYFILNLSEKEKKTIHYQTFVLTILSRCSRNVQQLSDSY